MAPKQPPKPWLIQVFWVLALGFLVFSLVGQTGGGAAETISYTRFRQLLADGQVLKVVVSGEQIRGDFKDKQPDGSTGFITQRVPPDLAEMLAARGVEVSAAPSSSGFGTLLGWVLPPLLFVGIWLGASRLMGGKGGGMLGGGLLSVGRSKARLSAETDVKVSFDDVAGVDEAKEELHEIVDFLRTPEDFGRLGAHIPRGILLVGPPGTGKTLLARAVAGEAGVAFFNTNGAEFVEMFVGVGAARVRDLFEQARAKSPCIIFIDELDALGRARGAAPAGGQDEKEQTLNQLLAEMDGFDRSAAIVILAATNRPEILDPALLRAGRFDRQVLVDRPEKKGRVQILKVHLKTIKLASDIDCDAIAAMTPGFTGADLANLANEAAVHATRRKADATAMLDFAAAVERIVAGLEKRSRVLIPRERRIVAYHEMGHALVARAIPGADPVQKVSIIPRGIAALGYTMQRPAEDRFLMGADELRTRMAVLMGGRAAETLIGPDVSTGAADDLARATDIARGMVARFGMGGALGPVAWDTETGHFLGEQGAFWHKRGYSEATAREIDDAVRRLLGEALARAIAILRTNRAALDAGAEDLLAHEMLTGDELPVPVPEGSDDA